MYLQKVVSTKIIFCWHPEGRCGKEQDPEPDLNTDPLVRGTDPGIRIRTKMSRIRKTALSPPIIYKKKFSTLQKINLHIHVSDGGRRAGMAEGCRGSEFRLHVQAAHHRYSTVRLKSRFCFFTVSFKHWGTVAKNA